MTIESSLERIADALEAMLKSKPAAVKQKTISKDTVLGPLTPVVEQPPTPPAATPAPAAPVAPQPPTPPPAAVAAPVPPAAPELPKIKREELEPLLVAKCVQLTDEGAVAEKVQAKVMGLIKTHGGKTISELPEEKFQALIDDVNSLTKDSIV
jgi:hypothetical protein